MFCLTTRADNIQRDKTEGSIKDKRKGEERGYTSKN